MSLEKIINEDIKTAMRAKESISLAALRAIKSAILLAKTEKGSSEELSEEQEMKILQKLAKQRKDSASLYQEQGRKDLFDEEKAQLKIIEKYLPEQLSKEEITEKIKKIIEESGASSMKDMGKVMGMASKNFAGKADNKMISEIVRQLLS